MREIERKTNAILHIIANSEKPIGSKEISIALKKQGIDLTERAIRYHLKIMDEKGLTEIIWKEGRSITELGHAELENALVSDKVGFVISRLSQWLMRWILILIKRPGKLS